MDSLHPIIVHFPVVFGTVAAILETICYLTKRNQHDNLYKVLNCCLIFWVLAMIPSIVTGLIAAEPFPKGNEDLDIHKNLAFFTFCAAVFSTIVHIVPYFTHPLISQLSAWFLTLLTFTLLVLTGDIGGGLSRGGKNFFTEEHFEEKALQSYYRKNPPGVRGYTVDQLKSLLAKKVGVADVEDVMRRYNCSSCHQNQFEGDSPAHFSTMVKNSLWLPRDSEGKLVDWPKSSFYKSVILLNRMPYDSDKTPLGISWADRLTLLTWLENGAPLSDEVVKPEEPEEEEEEEEAELNEDPKTSSEDEVHK